MKVLDSVIPDEVAFFNHTLGKIVKKDLDGQRRFSAEVDDGEGWVVYDHHFFPSKRIMSEIQLTRREAEDAANSLNCFLMINCGMEVSGLNDMHLEHLGGLPVHLREAILLYCASDFIRADLLVKSI